MNETRRRLLITIAGAAGALTLNPYLPGIKAQGSHPVPQPRPSPNAPDPHFPNGMNGPKPTGSDDKAIALANQKELRADVSKLFEMVSELKEQVEKTDANSTLSVSLVKKAHQIEKLAKQIKDLAKG